MAIKFFISFLFFFQEVVFKYIKLETGFDHKMGIARKLQIYEDYSKSKHLSGNVNDFSFQKCPYQSFTEILALSIYKQTFVALIFAQIISNRSNFSESCLLLVFIW